ncbi:MAG: threonine-phosphate decarboxylase [Gammaproteobacteria bacterium]|nr:threonine-phosphate decarboxylase [Gammaproteobacteria bacterium]
MPLRHGGRRREASRRFGIPYDDWLDLSTGINPSGWDVPAPPSSVWATLPEEGDGLEDAAASFYGSSHCLPVAGSQAALQLLPWLCPAGPVTLFSPSYQEHERAWRRAGHSVRPLPVEAQDIDADAGGAVVVVNPNNPTGTVRSLGQLLDWRERLAARGGWLIVDEAYLDPHPECSLIPWADQPGLIVLRSLGKFFGLAGLRLGFVFAEPALRQAIGAWLGPWPVAHPSRWAATQALRDRVWQRQTRSRLAEHGQRLATLLASQGIPPAGGCELFQWLAGAAAAQLHEALARQGVLTRRFDNPPGLRLGLPGDESAWARLAAALAHGLNQRRNV